MYALQDIVLGVNDKRANRGNSLFRAKELDRLLRIEQFQNNGWIEVILMVMADEYCVDSVPGFDSR